MLAYESATSLLDRLRSREIRAAERLEYFFARIEAHDAKTNALVHPGTERTHDVATHAHGAWAGLPIGVAKLLEREGFAFTTPPSYPDP